MAVRTVVFEPDAVIDGDVAPGLLDGAGAAAEVVQRLRARGPAESVAAQQHEVPLAGVVAELPVPGFADAPLSLAALADGSLRIIDHRGESARVAGTMRGPVGVMEEIEDKGVAGTARATVFSRRGG